MLKNLKRSLIGILLGLSQFIAKPACLNGRFDKPTFLHKLLIYKLQNALQCVLEQLSSLILLTELLRLLTGQMREEDLVMIQESEESPHGGADKA